MNSPKDISDDVSPPVATEEYKPIWKQFNIVMYILLHISALYGLYLSITEAKILTNIFAYLLYEASGIGITAGVHRLWSHRAYKAKWPLKVILVIFNSIAFQNSVFHWARDHRVHHKFSDTDADPHNSKRGFFFCHVGWLLSHKHPKVIEEGKLIDVSDLKNDPIVAFQHKYYLIIMPLCCFILPTLIPRYLWGESWRCSWFVAAIFRYTFLLHMTWFVNSAAHFWGNKPYEKNMCPSENKFVALGALGEGFHNFHHTFPWDYKGAELGDYIMNRSTSFIDFFAKIGWAYDMKAVSTDVIKKRSERTGDGSHPIWGWNDKDMKPEDKEMATRCNFISDPLVK